jgi:hypothetical protein
MIIGGENGDMMITVMEAKMVMINGGENSYMINGGENSDDEWRRK